MSISQQVNATISIYSVSTSRDTEGGITSTYTFVSSPKVMWLWQDSDIDSTKKQDNVGTSAVILTDKLSIFNQLEERGTVVLYAGKKYLVNSLKNTANKNQVFKAVLSESNIKDMVIVGGLSADGGATLGG